MKISYGYYKNYCKKIKRIQESMKRSKLMFSIIIVLAIVVFVFCDLWISSNYIVVREYSANISESSKSTIRTVVISDLHDHQFGANNTRLVEKIAGLEPDIIFMDGDMLNEDSDNSSRPCNLVQQLIDIAPVYYALGNHENAYISNGHPDLINQLEESGAVVLDKSYVDIEVEGVPIRLGGMYDYAFGLDGNNTALAAPEDVITFLKDYQNTERVKIMLSHRPESYVFGDASKIWNIDLIICGHVHGGQVVVPFIGGLYGGDQEWFPEYVHGLYKKDNFQMFITSGLGSNEQKLPRFNNPPEIAVLNIEV